MGYCGLGNWSHSDAASDALAVITDGMATTLDNELGRDHGSWNTKGYVNVALVFEGVIIPAALESSAFLSSEKLVSVAAKAKLRLEKALKNPLDKEHTAAYKRMVASLAKFIKKAEL